MKPFVFALMILCGGWCGLPLARGQMTESSPSAPTQPDPGGRRPREFQGDDLGQVLRLLGRQAKINLLVDDTITGRVDTRFENATALEAIEALARLYRLNLTKDEKGSYYLRPPDAAEVTLDLLARPETAARVAAFKHNLYEALMEEGFSSEEAFQVMNDSDLSATVNALAKKPQPAPSK